MSLWPFRISYLLYSTRSRYFCWRILLAFLSPLISNSSKVLTEGFDPFFAVLDGYKRLSLSYFRDLVASVSIFTWGVTRLFYEVLGLLPIGTNERVFFKPEALDFVDWMVVSSIYYLFGCSLNAFVPVFLLGFSFTLFIAISLSV